MPRAKQSNSKKTTKPESKIRWRQILFGFILGLAAPLLVPLAQNIIIPLLDKQAGQPSTNSTSQPADKMTFDFYELLPNQEVEVPESVEEVPEYYYELQAGSFKKMEDAETQRVKLLLLNLPVKISPITRDEVVWHRVLVGPFERKTFMSKARSILIENGISPLLLKRPINDP